jgi:hypothetical protein
MRYAKKKQLKLQVRRLDYDRMTSKPGNWAAYKKPGSQTK